MLKSKADQEKESYESALEFKKNQIETLEIHLKKKNLEQEEEVKKIKSDFQLERNDFRSEKGKVQ